ncbi:excalibur calcium-binding domain-containing protein [Rhodococcus opacus]|uniref:excalibur calcium-binding domain-containing protein n=1 Tax=Rhodococcus opacus TaxID=37919 RepID=UPI003CD02172
MRWRRAVQQRGARHDNRRPAGDHDGGRRPADRPDRAHDTRGRGSPASPRRDPGRPPGADPHRPAIGGQLRVLRGRKSSRAPIYQGEPGYSTKLDRDKDGIACDK